MKQTIPTLLLICSQAAFAGPWSDIDRSLPESRKQALAPVIAKQLKLEKVEVIESYYYQGWYIIHVGTFVSDDSFLFYKGDPLKSSFVTEWAGAAAINETDEIKSWVLTNAKGIPDRLASFFAWHVTKDRD